LHSDALTSSDLHIVHLQVHCEVFLELDHRLIPLLRVFLKTFQDDGIQRLCVGVNRTRALRLFVAIAIPISTMLSPTNGSCPVTSSYRITPSCQISVLWSFGLLVICSGAA
jgi:hypothetical protein